MSFLHALLHLLFLPPDRSAPPEIVRIIEGARRPVWQRAVSDLTAHRLTPALAFALRRHGLEGLVPDDLRSQLLRAYRDTLWSNTVHAQSLAQLLRGLESRGVRPIVLKGLVVAHRCYPDLGCRPMVDLDLLVTAEELAATEATFTEQGYVRRPGRQGFIHERSRVEIDLHTSLTIYSPAQCTSLSEEVEIPFSGIGTVRTFEPTALLLHLVTHLDKHRRRIGISLLWVLDITLLVRAERDRISVEALRSLAQEPRQVEVLWHVLQFAARECGAPPPEPFAEELAGKPGLSLPWLLRQRRLQPWGFPEPWFLARLGARLTGLRPLGQRRWLRWSDIPLGLLDCVAERSLRR